MKVLEEDYSKLETIVQKYEKEIRERIKVNY